MTLDLGRFIATNNERAAIWHPGFPDPDPDPDLRREWSLADWSNAMCGEAGEAANVVKKLRRIETGARGTDPNELTTLRMALAEELADTITYATLVASKAGVDLEAALVGKFNHVSAKNHIPVFMRTDGSATGHDES